LEIVIEVTKIGIFVAFLEIVKIVAKVIIIVIVAAIYCLLSRSVY